MRVQALCPGFIHTEFHASLPEPDLDTARIPEFMWGTPEAVAQASLAGLERGKTICVPGVQNRLIYLLARAGIVHSALSLAQRTHRYP